MARYIGPKTKFQENLENPYMDPTNLLKKGIILPDNTGITDVEEKSEYAIQLMEKQKAKYTYGILERQFRNLLKRPTEAKGSQVKFYYNYVNPD